MIFFLTKSKMRLKLYLFVKLMLTSFTFKPLAYILYVTYTYLLPCSEDTYVAPKRGQRLTAGGHCRKSAKNSVG